MTSDDIASATRGLQLPRRSEADLQSLRSRHAANQMFASRVICAAVDRVLEARAALRAEGQKRRQV